MTKKKIVTEWTRFAQELIVNECPEARNVDFRLFGTLMGRIVKKLGAAESVLWSGPIPTGTEDRTWVRTWLYALGREEYKGMLKSMDGAHAKRCLRALRDAGLHA